ncbi:hypothetical protein [Nocardioides marmotae]|uniref:hypothetical protein n=1 Tax=Nocardioides marmotae TaxID=2663857 RepID=UPI0012B644C0|nr:hypothetical protein [Nocardioides marmotae]MBC9735290.1 hypothetical protein [Nocardioides marmotae]MTB86390.1 hypothetical protein [Nocardioides marmotae]
MKKLIIGLLASVFMAAGLVGASTGSASAACNGYSGCVEPDKVIVDPVKNVDRGERHRAKMKLVVDGDATVKGQLRMVIKRGGNVVNDKRKPLNKNGAATLATPKLKPGRYQVILRFIPKNGSPFAYVTRKYWITVS